MPELITAVKASSADIQCASELVKTIQAAAAGQLVDFRFQNGHNQPVPFDPQNNEDLLKFYQFFMGFTQELSAFERIISGMSTLLDNGTLNPNVDQLELHPCLIEAKNDSARLNLIENTLVSLENTASLKDAAITRSPWRVFSMTLKEEDKIEIGSGSTVRIAIDNAKSTLSDAGQ